METVHRVSPSKQQRESRLNVNVVRGLTRQSVRSGRRAPRHLAPISPSLAILARGRDHPAPSRFPLGKSKGGLLTRFISERPSLVALVTGRLQNNRERGGGRGGGRTEREGGREGTGTADGYITYISQMILAHPRSSTVQHADHLSIRTASERLRTYEVGARKRSLVHPRPALLVLGDHAIGLADG